MYGVLARRNAIGVLIAVELMLNAVNLNLVAFDAYLRDALHTGQVFALFVITIAAAEVGIGLAIVLLVFRRHGHIAVDALRQLGETERDRRTDPGAKRRRRRRCRQGKRCRWRTRRWRRPLAPGVGERAMTDVAWLLPALPFVAALVGMLLGRKLPGGPAPVAIGGTLLATVVSPHADRQRAPRGRARGGAHPDRQPRHRRSAPASTGCR